LFNTSFKLDNPSLGTFDIGVAKSVVEESFDHIDVAIIEANLLEKFENGLVCNAVEGFAKVYEKDVVKIAFLERAVKLFVEKGEV